MPFETRASADSATSALARQGLTSVSGFARPVRNLFPGLPGCASGRIVAVMPRRRKAWLHAGSGVRIDRGRRLPGYYVRYYEYARDGGRVNHTIRFERQDFARRWVRQFNARADLRALGELVPISLEAAADEFAAGLSALRPGTCVHYLSAIGLLAGIVGNINACDVTGQHVDRFIAARLAVSARATVAKHLSSLRRFFRWCTRQGYAESDPVRDATTKPRGDFVRDRPAITEAQIELLIGAAGTDDRRLAIMLAITSGLDRGVIERLAPIHLDLDSLTIRLTRPKTQRRYVVPLHPRVAAALAPRCGQSSPAAPLLRGLTRQARAEDWWHRAAAQAGCPCLLFRDLRAVAATRLQRDAGLTLRDAQALLGHSTPETTARHYWVPSPEVQSAFARLPIPGCRETSGSTPG